MRQRRMSGSKVIERDADAGGTQCLYLPCYDAITSADTCVLAHFDDQTTERDASATEGILEFLSQAARIEIGGRNIEADLLDEQTPIPPEGDVPRNRHRNTLRKLRSDMGVAGRFPKS